ncbi:hypothetical protein BWQ96_07611 [Gracilariopsis chorda]|uniref:Uncharacterized protein n=1 Tax=Gracilariopsis chorda TaxID=448386 RepID=A0A2V3IKU0_9FLOR|nr:hypothetical protein BWQ96_07611 [Gracilariopsis chorda]|eukprot:PXF42668.1 hypothetical protein BWQ96_07611 [Gracilariopsis chorda]
MLSKIVALVALFGAAVAAPVRMSRGEIFGTLAGGGGFAAQGENTAGAAADGKSGIASGTSDDGAVMGGATPNGAFAGALGAGLLGIPTPLM